MDLSLTFFFLFFQNPLFLSCRTVSNEGITGLAPGVFNGLQYLKVIDLSDNHIETLLPDSFVGLTAAEEMYVLSILGCSRRRYDFNTRSLLLFFVFSSDLHGNDFDLLAPNLFSGMSNLTRISMQYNSLTSLPSNVFSGLSSLNSLYVSISVLGKDMYVYLLVNERCLNMSFCFSLLTEICHTTF